MSENAVERLQKLEKDIKTVISIYEAAKISNYKNGDTETELPLSDRDKSKWGLTDRCTSAFENFKRLAKFSPLIGSRIPFPTEKKKDAPIKPSSAPSSSSTGTGISESDYLWQEASWGNFPDSRNLLMTPSKILQAANEVLTKNNFRNGEVEYTDADRVDQNKTHQNKENDSAQNNQKIEISKVIKNESLQKKKPEKQNKEFVPTNCTPAVVGKELSTNSKLARNETASETPQKHYIAPKKISRTVKERLENFEIKKGENSSEHFNGSKRTPSQDKKNPSSQCKPSEKKNHAGDRNEEALKIRTEEKRNTKKKIQKVEEDEKLSAIEIFKTIARNNEKMEKMQASKELALDIAAQLKEKHEEICRSKKDMMKKLQKLEEDNERLNNEIKDAREKKRKLQLKMEGFCTYSKTKLLKQDLRSKEILEENELLKTFIKELEKKYNADYIDKLNEIDKAQQERLTEIRNELKNRETRAEEEIKRLVNEKTKLLEKVEELRITLLERQSNVENLEGKINALEVEVQRQKQNLKKKTEKLEQTHNELGAIRQNSKVLEEQVGTLRTNIQNFDQMQKNLMIGIEDRENQIKKSRTEIEKLELESANLKKELEKEKDIVLIKNKIIEDQQETIKQLREKSEEVKTLMKKNQSLERLLTREREEKLELQEAVECLKAKKEELKKKIKALEADLLMAPEEVVRDLQKTQMVLHELENQVHVKQKEWEHHLQLLVKEKEQACSVAEFATKKLMQATSKFQRQSDAHKKLHQLLAENLAEKQKRLRETISKENCEQINPFLLDVPPEMKRSSRQMFLRESVSGNDAAISKCAEWQPKKIFAVEEIRFEESP